LGCGNGAARVLGWCVSSVVVVCAGIQKFKLLCSIWPFLVVGLMATKRPYGGGGGGASSSSSSSGGGGNGANGGPKRPRAGTEDDEMGPSFEEELMMMDGMLDNILEDGGEGDLTAEQQEQRWKRPAVPEGCDLTEEALAFQWMDIDMTSGQPLPANPAGGDILGSREGPVPIIRLYGVTKQGRSVLLSVHGFTPYFYVSVPTSMDLSQTAYGLGPARARQGTR
jgi:hypothetical protein